MLQAKLSCGRTDYVDTGGMGLPHEGPGVKRDIPPIERPMIEDVALRAVSQVLEDDYCARSSVTSTKAWKRGLSMWEEDAA